MPWSMADNGVNPRLEAWLVALLDEAMSPLQGEIGVAFGSPGPDGGPATQAGRKQQGINLHLLSIAPHARAAARVERRTELQLVLRYLATSWAAQREIAESLLCNLAFLLIGRGASGPDGTSEIVVDSSSPPLEVLAALGLPPRPALMLELRLVHVDAAAPARRVEHPPSVRAESAGTLRGIVVGPEEMPIAAAQVELPALGRVTETDPAGKFRFTGVPAKHADQMLRVRARGLDRTFRLSAGGEDTVTLRMSLNEEG